MGSGNRSDHIWAVTDEIPKFATFYWGPRFRVRGFDLFLTEIPLNITET